MWILDGERAEEGSITTDIYGFNIGISLSSSQLFYLERDRWPLQFPLGIILCSSKDFVCETKNLGNLNHYFINQRTVSGVKTEGLENESS